MRKNGKMMVCGYECVLHCKPVHMGLEKLASLMKYRGEKHEIFGYYKKPSLRKIRYWYNIVDEIASWADRRDAWVHIVSANGWQFTVEGVYSENDVLYFIKLTSQSAHAWVISID